MKKEIEAFVNAANEQELEAAWNNLSAEEQRAVSYTHLDVYKRQGQIQEADNMEWSFIFFLNSALLGVGLATVSYTHLDVYKRQKATYQAQSRGGRGISGMTRKEEDIGGEFQRFHRESQKQEDFQRFGHCRISIEWPHCSSLPFHVPREQEEDSVYRHGTGTPSLSAGTEAHPAFG